MVNPLLIVQTERLSATDPQLFGRTGDMAEMFRRAIGAAIPTRIVNAAEEDPLPPPEELAGAIICGAAAMASDPDPWIDRLGAWLEQAIHAKLPLLGVCFGHQLLAHRLGGTVSPNANGPEYGTVDIEILAAAQNDRLLVGMPVHVAVQAAHFQTVTTLPTGAIALACGNSGIHAARFSPACWGLQFHPEFVAADMEAIIMSVAARQAPPLAAAMAASVLQLRETPQAATLIRRFAEMIVEG